MNTIGLGVVVHSSSFDKLGIRTRISCTRIIIINSNAIINHIVESENDFEWSRLSINIYINKNI